MALVTDPPDLRPLLTYPDSKVMTNAANVVGNMVQIAGVNLGESFFTKEVGQALQMIDGETKAKVNVADSS